MDEVAALVEAGRALQEWLSIPADRVEWIVGNVMDHSPAGMDFVYLYRPVRPTGVGRAFYERFAAEAGLDPHFAVLENRDELVDEALEQLC